MIESILDSMRNSIAPRSLQRAIAKVKQRWSDIGWVTINFLEFLRASVGTLSFWFRLLLHSLSPTNLGLIGGLWPVLLKCNP
jgi:hypothetical protein